LDIRFSDKTQNYSISTLKITVSSIKFPPACSVFNKRSLATASNFVASRPQSFLSSEYPANKLSQFLAATAICELPNTTPELD
jgi:hypothetical protein